MVARLSAMLDGIAPDAAAPDAVLVDVIENAPEETLRTMKRGSAGLCVTEKRRGSLSVTLSFALRTRSAQHRAQALEQLRAWAQGSCLTLGHRPDRLLRVRCTSLPAMGSALCHADTVQAVLTAFDVPYWQHAHLSRLSLEGEGAMQGALYVPGTAPASPLFVSVQSLSDGQVDTLRITCNDTVAAFAGLALTRGDTLTLRWDDADRMIARVLSPSGEERSVLDCLEPTSHDQLLCVCGKASTVRVEGGDAALSAVVSARGRYL